MRVVFLTIKGLRFKRFDKTEERTKPIHHQKFVTLCDFLCINSTFDIMNSVYITTNIFGSWLFTKMWIYNKLNVKYASKKGKFFKRNLRVIVLRHFAQKLYNEDFHSSHTLLNSKVNRNNPGGKIRFLFLFSKLEMNVWM